MTTNEEVQLVIIPGIGEDNRMAYPQHSLPYNIIALGYIEPLPKESLAEYSKRYAQLLIETNTIDLTKPLFLMGVSLGGAIVQEMSCAIKANGVILISTYRSSKELGSPLPFLGKYVSPLLPKAVYQFATLLAAFVIPTFAKLSKEDLALCSAMYRDHPKNWFRRFCYMATTWPGCTLHTPKLRIHGAKDPIMPHWKRDEIDILIPDDMHMCNLTNKELVNVKIQEFITSQLSTTDTL